MAVTIRSATDGDLDGVARLTARHRARLARWSPRWWRPSAAADQFHRSWLQHLINGDGPTVRVADDDGTVVACAVSMPQPNQWFIDDIAVGDRRWHDVGTSLIGAIPERPALTCTASQDETRLEMLHHSGLTHVSSYWIRDTGAGAADTRSVGVGPAEPVDADTPVPDPPTHTFGGALDPHADGALFFAQGDGLIVGSGSVAAPPVYDPGGTVCIVDRVVNVDDDLLRTAIAATGQRGDVLICIVAGVDDEALQRHLTGTGFTRTVDVHRWP